MRLTFSNLRLTLAVAAAQLAMAGVAVPAGAASLTLNDPNCESFSLSGSPGAQVISCVASNSSGAPNCQINGSTVGTVGSPVTLTASCSGSPSSYQWSGGNCTGAGQSCQAQATAAGQVNYYVTATNGAGSGQANTTVAWSDQPPPGGSGGPIAACAGFTNTKVIDATFPANGSGSNRYYYTSSSNVFNNATSGFGANDAVVVRFTTPATDAYMNLSMYETGAGTTGQPSYRTITLSRQACDFQVPRSANALYAVNSTGFSVNISVATGTQRYNLQPNTTYYVNVNNYVGSDLACMASRCDVFFLLTNPTP
jgi:hypothetical protein